MKEGIIALTINVHVASPQYTRARVQDVQIVGASDISGSCLKIEHSETATRHTLLFYKKSLRVKVVSYCLKDIVVYSTVQK